MESFWDARARKDPYFFVDSRRKYGAPGDPAFWAGGEEALGNLLGGLGVQTRAGQAVVDIGCGLGRLTRPLARGVDSIIAIDVSSEMIQQARELNAQLENVEWIHGDGRSLRPIADASVDVCISHVVFRHIPDPLVTLGYVREMARVLRPGGFAAFELSNDRKSHRRPTLSWRDRAAAVLGRGPITDAAWLGSHVDLDELSRVTLDCGLNVERVVGEGTEFCAVLLRAPGA